MILIPAVLIRYN